MAFNTQHQQLKMNVTPHPRSAVWARAEDGIATGRGRRAWCATASCPAASKDRGRKLPGTSRARARMRGPWGCRSSGAALRHQRSTGRRLSHHGKMARPRVEAPCVGIGCAASAARDSSASVAHQLDSDHETTGDYAPGRRLTASTNTCSDHSLRCSHARDCDLSRRGHRDFL